MTTTTEVAAWHIIRAADHEYIETFRGTREEAEARAAKGVWTMRGQAPAYIMRAEPDYPATIAARRMYGEQYPTYPDYIQGSLAVKAATGRGDRRGDSLGSLFVGNDGD